MDPIPLQHLRCPKATKENHFHDLSSTYIYSTLPPLYSRHTEQVPDLQVVLPITMSLKSLVISFPRPLHYSFPALPLWPFHSLSHCSSHPALLHSQRLKIKEIKHRHSLSTSLMQRRNHQSYLTLLLPPPLSASA